MTISRLDRVGLIAVVGAEAAKRLEQKILGGASAWKGYRYETLFGAHRIARLLGKLIDTGEDALLEWQSKAFVDDIVVRRDGRHSFKGYQLKNSASTVWSSEIEEDFRSQHAVSGREGYTDVRLRLMCSDDAAVSRLTSRVPGDIAAYSRARFFPWDEAPLVVLNGHPWMAQDFGYLSRHVTPDSAEVENVLRIVLGAWLSMPSSTKVSDVFHKMRKTSPTMIRTQQSDAEARAMLDPALVVLLGGLANFQYHIERGFLNWNAYGGRMRGTYSHDCFSDQFKGLQKFLIAHPPASFDDIESLLQ